MAVTHAPEMLLAASLFSAFLAVGADGQQARPHYSISARVNLGAALVQGVDTFAIPPGFAPAGPLELDLGAVAEGSTNPPGIRVLDVRDNGTAVVATRTDTSSGRIRPRIDRGAGSQTLTMRFPPEDRLTRSALATRYAQFGAFDAVDRVLSGPFAPTGCESLDSCSAAIAHIRMLAARGATTEALTALDDIRANAGRGGVLSTWQALANALAQGQRRGSADVDIHPDALDAPGVQQ